MLKKRSVVLAGHATSVALEPEFWVVLDHIAAERDLSQAGLLAWIDQKRGRRSLASACRLLALETAMSERITGGSEP
jgi:predicted DNA-binding ribbon-helix-helix protein